MDFVGTVVIAATAAVNLNAFVSTLQVQRPTRLLLAVVMGGWIGVAAASAAGGILALARPFPLIGLFVAVPLIAGLVAVFLPGPRAKLVALPLELLIGMSIARVLGVLFLLLVAQGRLSGPFPYFAGIGDIVTGLVAIGLVARLGGGKVSAAQIAAWNAFGAADLVLALALGVTSAPGSTLQIFGGAIGSMPMQFLPWTLIPTVLVPFYLVLHAVIWINLRQGQVGQATSSAAAAITDAS